MTDSEDKPTTEHELALPAGFNLVDVIADFPQGQEVVDLSILFSSWPADEQLVSPVEASVSVPSDAHIAGAPGDGTVELASLEDMGVGSLISILYDDSKPIHQEHVT